MRRSVGHGAVAGEEESHFIVLFAVLDGVADARRQRHLPGYDAVPSEKTATCIKQVHGAAASAGYTVAPAKELGHDVFGLSAAGDDMPVLAIKADDPVLLSQRQDRACDHRFLTVIGVEVASDPAPRVHLPAAIIEAPDKVHDREHVMQILSGLPEIV